jgi:hypothetical protein
MKLALTLALALGLATATLCTPAHACGFVSREDEVRRAVAAERGGDTWNQIHAVTFLADGRAQVELRWGQRDGEAIGQLYWFALDEDWTWQPHGRSYTFTVWLDDKSADARPPTPKQQRLKSARSRSRQAVAAR